MMIYDIPMNRSVTGCEITSTLLIVYAMDEDGVTMSLLCRNRGPTAVLRHKDDLRNISHIDSMSRANDWAYIRPTVDCGTITLDIPIPQVV